ncbi:helix-turn-helix transcriptional regulator [Acrocarpospora phusangensis]|uniref:Helix-turn-helix transcriptional regulator n=1 Tax=Acrocarpospora phusangensis TaxID=1070424 RepID=A0A919Q8J3_9ACTN|nr:helix-turn-helix transcriptional regulator [Acrocarpospora phusangensis]GIH23496.1 helix-turn-helix transcriptional regulator [Acrocarpospora phusangensis]
MTGSAIAHRLVASIQRVDARCATVEEFLTAVSGEVRKVVPFDGSMWFGVDPSTLLAAAPARLEHMDPSFCRSFWHGEFHDNDVLRFRDLARQPDPAGSLRTATDGKPLRSPRYRDFLRPQGYDDEVRVAFRTGTTTWAVAGLYREKGRRAFDADELKLLGSISHAVGVALRTRNVLHSPSARAIEALRAPGVLLFDAKGMLMSANLHARAWLREVYGPDLVEESWTSVLSERSTSPALRSYPAMWERVSQVLMLQALVSQAQAVALGYEDGPARLRCRSHDGRWVVLHASCMDETDPDSPTAVVIEPAQSAEVAPIIVEAYGLTPREREVLRSIACGLSTPEIAAELVLSAHTVRDYIKSVFEKVGVSSRGELTAKLFAEHYSDALHVSLVHV